jgi:hypothetical protein
MENSSNVPIKNKNKIAVELKISFKIFILTVLVTILFIISLLIYDGYFKVQFGEESDVVDKFNELTNYAYSCEGCLLETLSASEIKDYVTSKILEEDFEVAIIFFGITFISIIFLRYFVKLIKWVKENS